MSLRMLSSREVENIFENSDFVYMLNQAGGDRQILARQLGISPVSYTHLFVMECLHNNTTEIRNMKQYLLTVLFNAPTTMNNHYTAQVNHDMHAGGW